MLEPRKVAAIKEASGPTRHGPPRQVTARRLALTARPALAARQRPGAGRPVTDVPAADKVPVGA